LYFAYFFSFIVGIAKNISTIASYNLITMNFACKNLRYLRKLRGWTQDEFATRLGIKRSLLGAYEEERAEPKFEVLEISSKLFKLSLDELLLTDLSDNLKTNSYLEQRRNAKSSAEVALVHFVPVKAAAGYLAGYADPDFVDELNTFTLPMLAPGNYRAFEIVGDSMLPTPSGSVVVGEKIEKIEDLKNSGSYVVLSKNEGIVYKRIQKNNKQKNKLTLISDNPIYEPYLVSQEDILEIWKAVYIIQKANSVVRWDLSQLPSIVSSLQDEVSYLKKKMA
jgi:transcriptional regulator with XRE-family HTH domain